MNFKCLALLMLFSLASPYYLMFKSAGPGKWPPRVLKELAHEISGQVMLIFNKYWDTLAIPEGRKRATAGAVFKTKTNGNNLSN